MQAFWVEESSTLHFEAIVRVLKFLFAVIASCLFPNLSPAPPPVPLPGTALADVYDATDVATVGWTLVVGIEVTIVADVTTTADVVTTTDVAMGAGVTATDVAMDLLVPTGKRTEEKSGAEVC